MNDKLFRHRFAIMRESMRSRRSSVKGARQIVCTKCGQGGGTLVKSGDDYRHEVCPPKIGPILSKDEVWANRRPVEREQEITKPENIIEVPEPEVQVVDEE